MAKTAKQKAPSRKNVKRTAPARRTPAIVRSAGVVSTEELVKELDALIHQKSRDRTKHPFVKAVLSGKATKNQIAGWLHQFALWADPSNKLFGVMWARCPDDDLREGVLENMLEEEYGEFSKTAGHMRLIDKTLEELGWSKKKQEADTIKLESCLQKHWIEVVIRNRPFVESLAATSFTAERMNPFVFALLEKGLRKHYDLTEDGLRSISVHASDVEEEHGSLGPIAMRRYATTKTAQEGVRFAVEHTADIYYNQYNVWNYY
jgi:pyrroloquinoline quinone (PQQ) biosynthesis protein C